MDGCSERHVGELLSSSVAFHRRDRGRHRGSGQESPSAFDRSWQHRRSSTWSRPDDNSFPSTRRAQMPETIQRPFPATTELTAAHLRASFACFPSGVAAVCALIDGEPVGMVMSSFTSVSLDPPLVSVCVDLNSSTWPRLRSAPWLGVSILGEGCSSPRPVSRWNARSTRTSQPVTTKSSCSGRGQLSRGSTCRH